MNLLKSKTFKKWLAPPLIITFALVLVFFIGLIEKIGSIENYKDVWLALISTIAAGVILGLVYPIIRMLFRNKGKIGDILTGICLMNIYFLGFGLLLDFDWEQLTFKDSSLTLFMQVFATILGVALGWDSFFTGLEQIDDNSKEEEREEI